MDAITTPLEKATFLRSTFAATAAAHDRDGTFPFENFRHLADNNLLSLRLPRGLGGQGASLRDAAHVVGVVASGEPATALVLAMHYIQCAAMARSPHWPRHIVETLARDTVAGVSLGNALRVEPELGTPARGGLPATTARRVGDTWRLSGRKIYSTGSPILAWYAVWAKTDEAAPRVGTFLVPVGLPGTRIEETWDHIGLRASGSHDVLFDDVTIPLDHAVDIRAPEAWLAPDPTQHVENGVFLAALYNGVAVAAGDWLVGFLKTRVPTSLGAPLSTLPRVREAVGGIAVQLRVNRRLIDSVATDVDLGRLVDAAEAHVLKSVVTNNAIQTIETALTLTGNHGLTRNNPLERHHRDVLCGRVHTPQDDSVRFALGGAALT